MQWYCTTWALYVYIRVVLGVNLHMPQQTRKTVAVTTFGDPSAYHGIQTNRTASSCWLCRDEILNKTDGFPGYWFVDSRQRMLLLLQAVALNNKGMIRGRIQIEQMCIRLAARSRPILLLLVPATIVIVAVVLLVLVSSSIIAVVILLLSGSCRSEVKTDQISRLTALLTLLLLLLPSHNELRNSWSIQEDVLIREGFRVLLATSWMVSLSLDLQSHVLPQI